MGPMTAFLKRLSAHMQSRKAQLALALRVTVAAVGAFAIASALHLVLPLWAVLTSLIVTQMSVGRSLKATRDYMFSTLGGAIYGGAVAVLIPRSIAFSRSRSARSPGFWCRLSCCRRGRIIRSGSAPRGCSN